MFQPALDYRHASARPNALMGGGNETIVMKPSFFSPTACVMTEVNRNATQT
jgi:hypothetical protein